MEEWLINKGLKKGIFPTLFDLPELWKINSKRCRGFNIIFFIFYIPFITLMIPYTLLLLVEGIIKGE